MPVNNTLGSGVQDQLNVSSNSIIAEFHLALEEQVGLRATCRAIPLKPGEGESKQITKWARLQAYDLEDGIDMAQGQALVDTKFVFTPAEVGVQVIRANTSVRRSANRQFDTDIGRLAANAYRRKEDEDVAAQFDSWTVTALGGQGTIMGVGHLFAAEAALRVGGSTSSPEPAPGKHWGAFNPMMLAAVAGRLIPLATQPDGQAGYTPGGNAGTFPAMPVPKGSVADMILRGGPNSLVGRTIAGTTIISNANITPDSAADSKGGVYSSEAIIFVPEFEAAAVPEPDASLRAIEQNLVGSYAVGLFTNGWGAEMYFDASIPTS